MHCNCWLHTYKQENRNTNNCYSVLRQCKVLHCNAGDVKGIMEGKKEPALLHKSVVLKVKLIISPYGQIRSYPGPRVSPNDMRLCTV